MATKTKGQIAELAAKQLGISTRTKEASPEEIQDIVDFMESWAASTNAIGMRVGYTFEENPKSTTESGIPNWAERGFWSSIAVEMCPYFGRQATAEMIKAQRSGLQTITNETVMVKEYQYPERMPTGSGDPYRVYGQRYYRNADRIRTDGDFLEDEGGDTITGG